MVTGQKEFDPVPRFVSQTRYKPWGEERNIGAFAGGALPTDFRYTGQRKSDTGTGVPRIGLNVFVYRLIVLQNLGF
jgi:hypothetical protein